MHHTELYLGVRFLTVGIVLAFVFVPLVWGTDDPLSYVMK
jgi:hypothetical protein